MCVVCVATYMYTCSYMHVHICCNAYACATALVMHTIVKTFTGTQL